MAEPVTPERAFAEGIVFFFSAVELMAKLKPSSMASQLIVAEMLSTIYQLTAKDCAVPDDEVALVRGLAHRYACTVYEQTAGPAVRAATAKAALLKADADFGADERAAAGTLAAAAIDAILASRKD
jgi:hypothetical protein